MSSSGVSRLLQFFSKIILVFSNEQFLNFFKFFLIFSKVSI